MATAADLHLLGIGYRMVRGGEEDFARASARVRRSGKEAAESVSAVDGATAHLRTRFAGFLSPARAVDAALAAIAVTSVALAVTMGSAVRISAEFEAALVGVGKTANIEGAALRALGDEVDLLSRRIPVAAREILEIAQSAGQLGVQGSANILRFAETVAKLGRSSDLAGEEGATALARILNVTGEAMGTVGTLASVIVALGNNFAATESQIAHHTGQVARATAVYEIGSAQAAAMGTTLAAFGVRAELSGSAVGRTFRVIEDAVKSGGEKMAALSVISNASAEEIRAAWGRGPIEAFNLFLRGVRDADAEGKNVAKSLRSISLEGEEVLSVIPVLAKQFDTLARAQSLAARETADPQALETEFARAAVTLQAEFDLLRNVITSTLRVIGDQLAPVVKDIVVDLRRWFEANRQTAQSLGTGLAQGIKGAIAAGSLLVQNLDLIIAALVGIGTALLVVNLAPLVLEVVAATRAFLAATAALRVTSVALVGVSGAVATVRAAWASLTATLAANPVGIVAAVVAALAGTLVLLALEHRKAKREAEQYHAELESGVPIIDGQVRALDDLATRLTTEIRLRKELALQYNESYRALNALAPVLAEIETALASGNNDAYAQALEKARALGVEIRDAGKQSGGYNQVRAEVERLRAELDATRAAQEQNAIVLQSTQDKVRAQIEEQVETEKRAIVERKALLADLALEAASTRKQIVNLVPRDFGDFNTYNLALRLLQSELAEIETKALKAGRGLRQMHENLAQLRNDALLRAGDLFQQGDYDRGAQLARDVGVSEPEIKRAIEQQKALTAAQEETRRKAEELRRTREEGASATKAEINRQEQLRQRYQETTAELDDSIAGHQRIARAYEQSTAAGRLAEQQVQDQARAAQAASQFEGQMADAVRNRTLAEAEAARKSQGAKQISALSEQVKQWEKLVASFNDSVNEADGTFEELERQQEVMALQFQQTNGVAEEQVEWINELVAKIYAFGQALEFRRRRADVRAELDDLRELVDVYQEGTAAIAETLVRQGKEAEIRRLLAGLTKKQRDELRPLVLQLVEYRDTLEALNKVSQLRSDAEFTVRLSEIEEQNPRLRRLEEQYLTFLRNLGNGSVEFGQQVFSSLGASFGVAMAQVWLWLQRIDDAAQIEAVRGASKTGRDLYREERERLLRLDAEYGAKDVALRKDINAKIDQLDRDHWSAQVDLWSTGLDVIAGLVGGFFAELVHAAQQAYGIYQQLSSAATNAGYSANAAAGLGAAGATVAIFAAVYSIVDQAIKDSRARRFGNAASFTIAGGDEGISYLDSRSQEVARGIRDAVRALEDALGLAFEDLAQIQIKVRNDGKRVQAFVEGVLIGVFGSVEEAIGEALRVALSSPATQISGLTQLMREGLQSFSAPDFDELIRFLQDLREIGDLGLTQGAVTIREAVRHFDQLWDTLSKVPGATDAVRAGFSNLVQAELRAWQDWQDQLTGRQRSPAEQLAALREEGRMFEASREMRKADLQIKKIELQLEREMLLIRGRQAEGRGRLAQAELDLDREIFRGKAAVLKAEVSLFDQWIAAIDAQLRAIDILIEGLDKLKIDPDSLKLPPGAGGAGAGGQSLRDMISESERQRELDGMTEYGRAAAEINRRWDEGIKAAGDQDAALQRARRRHREAIEAAKGNEEAVKKANEQYERATRNINATRQEIEAANRAREEELRLLRQRTIEDLYGRVRDYEQGAGTGGPQEQLAAIQEEAQILRDDFLKTAQELGFGAARIAAGLGRITAAERARIVALTEQVIGGLGLPMEQTRQEVVALAESLDFLRQMAEEGILDPARLDDIQGQMRQKAEGQLFELTATILEAMGRTREAQAFRARMEEANFLLQVAQLNYLYQQYTALGLISAKSAEIIEEALNYINDPKNRPNFNNPVRDDQRRFQGYDDASGSGSATETERRRQQILDLITEWNRLGKSDPAKELRELSEKLEAAKSDASRFGISLDDLMAAHGRAVENFWDEALSQFEDPSDNLIEQLADLNLVFDELAAAAQQYGGDLARIEAARAREIERFWDEALAPIRELRERFQVGELGGLSPEQRLQEAQNRFNDLAQRALAGDAAAIQALPGAVEALLEQQRAYSGSGPAYQALVNMIQGVLDQVLALAGGPAGAAGVASLPPADFAAGVPVPVAYGGLVAPERPGEPRPAPLPVALPGAAGPVPVPDERVDRLVSIVEDEAAGRREDRRANEDLRAEVDRLVDTVREQQQDIADLVTALERLSSLVESQERRMAQGGR